MKPTGFAESAREKNPGNSIPASSGCPWRKVGGKLEGTYLRPKDSNATVGVHDHATGKELEGTDRQTDKQTDRQTLHTL